MTFDAKREAEKLLTTVCPEGWCDSDYEYAARVIAAGVEGVGKSTGEEADRG